MRTFIPYLFLLFFGSNFSTEAKITPENLEVVNLYSSILDENRELKIYLPAAYKSSYASYPVIYIMDGDKYFDMMVEMIDFMIENHSIPPHIVVGINNDNLIRDMTPEATTMHKKIYPMRGGADQFLEVFQKEIQPKVSEKYRVRSRNVIVGHGFSGLFGLYAMVHQPELFEYYLLFSPNIWWDNRAVVNVFEEKMSEKMSFRKRLYMSIGKEGKEQLLACELLVDVLKNKIPGDFDWDFEWIADETHYSLVKQSLMSGLEKVFEDYKFPTENELVVGGYNAYQRYKANVLLTYGQDVKLPYTILQSVGNTLLQKGKNQEGIRFFQEGVKMYPSNEEALYQLARAYEQVRDIPMATLFFEKAFEMAPGRKDYEVSLFRIRQSVQDSISEITEK